MDSASFEFVLFGLCVAILSNFTRSPAGRSAVLLSSSIGFLWWLSPYATAFLPLSGFLLLGYAGLTLVRRPRPALRVMFLCAIICCYVWLKKYTFLPESLLLSAPYLTLGLSYVFFRVLHLVIEAGDNEGQRTIGLGAYLCYTLNFTTFVSGPIQRYDDFARDQFAREPIALGPRVIGVQLERLVRGFFKVNVLALLLSAAHDDALMRISQPGSAKVLPALQLILAYPLFLYCNFSGYIDMVIALARLMRLRLPENFDRPFSASSFIDFWSRWHMTLSDWLKNYVYNPLLIALMRRISSARVEPLLAVFSYFITFFLIGIWHGRTSEFVVFGALQGAGVSVNKLWQLELTRILGRKGYQRLALQPYYVSFGRGLTFIWFAFTLLWFWGDWAGLKRVFVALSGLQWLGAGMVAWLASTVVLESWERLRRALVAIRTPDEQSVLASRYVRMVFASALGLVAFVMTALLNEPAPAIVYKAF